MDKEGRRGGSSAGGDALACSGRARAVRGAHCPRRSSGGNGFLRAAVRRERGQQGEGERGGLARVCAALPPPLPTRHGDVRTAVAVAGVSSTFQATIWLILARGVVVAKRGM